MVLSGMTGQNPLQADSVRPNRKGARMNLSLRLTDAA